WDVPREDPASWTAGILARIFLLLRVEMLSDAGKEPAVPGYAPNLLAEYGFGSIARAVAVISGETRPRRGGHRACNGVRHQPAAGRPAGHAEMAVAEDEIETGMSARLAEDRQAVRSR